MLCRTVLSKSPTTTRQGQGKAHEHQLGNIEDGIALYLRPYWAGIKKFESKNLHRNTANLDLNCEFAMFMRSGFPNRERKLHPCAPSVKWIFNGFFRFPRIVLVQRCPQEARPQKLRSASGRARLPGPDSIFPVFQFSSARRIGKMKLATPHSRDAFLRRVGRVRAAGQKIGPGYFTWAYPIR